MDNELDLSRYAAGLRRHAIVIACVAFVGLLGGVAVALRSSYTTVVEVQASPKVLDLVSVGLDAEAFDLDGVIDALTADVSQDSFEDEISSEIGDEVAVAGARDPERPRLTITISSSSESAAAAAATLVGERLQDRYVQDVTTDVSRLRDGTDLRRQQINAQLADVDSQLQNAGDQQQTLVEGLFVERQRLIDRLEAFDAVVSALDRFESELGAGLRRTVLQTPEQRSLPLMAIAGLIGGAALAVGISLARTALDRTVRTRRDLAKVGITDLVGVIPQSESDLAINSAKRAVQALARNTSSEAVQVMPINDRTDTTWMDRLGTNGGGSTTITVLQPLSTSAEAVDHASDRGLSILAVEWGKDSMYDVVRAANELSAAGAGHVAVLLFAVPAREMSGVER